MLPNRRVVIGCTMLAAGKQGVLKKDEHGYYLNVPLGAYDAFNSGGFLYDRNSALAQFQPTSPLMRMLQKGVLYAEYTHPEKLPGMNDTVYVQRIRRIDMNKACAHIRAIYLEPSKDEKGRSIVLVTGDVMPFGPYAHCAEAALSNPHINSFFSVRSITMDDRMNMIKFTREIVTWDMVGEGGILQANKYNSPSLESFEDTEVEITPTILWQLADEQKKQLGLGMESVGLDFESLAKDLGWERQKAVVAKRPAFTRW